MKLQAARVRKLMFVDGKRVERTVSSVCQWKAYVRLVFTDGTSATYLADDDVNVTKARCEIPAGPTPSDTWFVAGAPKPTLDPRRGKWRGEKGSKRDDMIAIAKAFDAYAYGN